MHFPALRVVMEGSVLKIRYLTSAATQASAIFFPAVISVSRACGPKDGVVIAKTVCTSLRAKDREAKLVMSPRVTETLVESVLEFVESGSRVMARILNCWEREGSLRTWLMTEPP